MNWLRCKEEGRGEAAGADLILELVSASEELGVERLRALVVGDARAAILRDQRVREGCVSVVRVVAHVSEALLYDERIVRVNRGYAPRVTRRQSGATPKNSRSLAGDRVVLSSLVAAALVGERGGHHAEVLVWSVPE